MLRYILVFVLSLFLGLIIANNIAIILSISMLVIGFLLLGYTSNDDPISEKYVSIGFILVLIGMTSLVIPLFKQTYMPDLGTSQFFLSMSERMLSGLSWLLGFCVLALFITAYFRFYKIYKIYQQKGGEN